MLVQGAGPARGRGVFRACRPAGTCPAANGQHVTTPHSFRVQPQQPPALVASTASDCRRLASSRGFQDEAPRRWISVQRWPCVHDVANSSPAAGGLWR